MRTNVAHITFIHGIENKPAVEVLLDQWRQSLAADDGLNLESLGVSSSMIYWADVLYPEPTAALEESVASAGMTETELVGQLAEAVLDDEESRFLAGLMGKLSVATIKSLAAAPSVFDDDSIEERIPLPWVVKERLMAVLLRDVHHYLFNKEFSPRPGEAYWVRDEIRRRFVEGATLRSPRTGPHVVVAHSMGTVIAYDCLLRVASCPAVDGLLTIGSPLGLDEIQDKMQPEWTRSQGFPARKLASWVNVFDSLDPVAGFDPCIANDFRRGARRAVVDILEPNWGWWRHDIAKYLSGPKLRQALRSLLHLPATELSPASESAVRRRAAPRSRPAASWCSIEDLDRWLIALKPSHATAAASDEGRPNAGPLNETLAETIGEPKGRVSFIAELGEAILQIKEEAAEQGGNVMSSPRHRLASLIQTEVASWARRAKELNHVEILFDDRDSRHVLRNVLSRRRSTPNHPQPRPSSAVPGKLPGKARIFLVSDFGTGLYGAPVIAASVTAQTFDLTMHLGDIYYSGREEEVRDRFLSVWPRNSAALSRTLNGNHDMYSGGYGYFDVALTAFEQESSYFAFQNESWLLVALDTAYRDNDVGKRQRRWLDDVVAQAGSRRLILFSHHPLFSNFKDQGTKIAQRLAELLESKRITAWYWGHEHHAVLYEPHATYGLRARCLGNGGMPHSRKKLRDFPVERCIGEFCWRRGPALVTPPSLYLDGPNKFITEEPDKYGPHGYMTLEFDGPRVEERVFAAEGTELFRYQYS